MKNKIITYTFIIFILTFSILHIIIPDKEISTTERRKLSSFPNFEISNKYITKVEKYLLDHFPIRDTFRSIKANFNYKVLNRLDNNQIYLKDDYIFKSEYPTNKKSIDNFINKTNTIKDILTPNNKTYLMLVPDKNYYLDDSNFLKIDYNYLFDRIKEIDAKFIDIRDIMELEDYYETDTHWKQERLDKVIKKMSNIMNFDYKNINYKKHVFDNFYGVYYGESAIKRPPETITYLTNDTIDNASVYYFENDKLNKVYNMDNLNSLDSYEVYLDGASSYIEITNSKANNNKELVIFRDSFGSSLSPLLINYYSKITIIDNRYISTEYFLKNIEFTNQDVLFMYSTLVVNNSVTLKG